MTLSRERVEEEGICIELYKSPIMIGRDKERRQKGYAVRQIGNQRDGHKESGEINYYGTY